jgi:hypothetical protein
MNQVETFIERWRANRRSEAANAKAHFLDLCTLLDVPPPTSDPTGASYAFEKAMLYLTNPPQRVVLGP